MEDLLQALHLLFGFLQMDGECALELLGLRGFCHLRQGFEDGILGEVGILELVQKERFQILVGHGRSPVRWCRGTDNPSGTSVFRPVRWHGANAMRLLR